MLHLTFFKSIGTKMNRLKIKPGRLRSVLKQIVNFNLYEVYSLNFICNCRYIAGSLPIQRKTQTHKSTNNTPPKSFWQIFNEFRRYTNTKKYYSTWISGAVFLYWYQSVAYLQCREVKVMYFLFKNLQSNLILYNL